MMNVFAEQSPLSWEQHGNPWLPGHHYATTDGKYRITPQSSPWEPDNKDKYVWLVEVPMYGPQFYKTVKAAPTFADAVAYAEKDADSPVWTETDQECRWCGMAKSDLIVYPRWWFGCDLCETEIQKEQTTIDTPDNEYEPSYD